MPGNSPRVKELTVKISSNLVAGLIAIVLGIVVLVVPVVIQWILGIVLIVVGILAVLGRQKIV